jgi:glycosyltransferase involved in cell wall biosynthesis
LRIALDATYSFGENLSGVGVYSREILNGLASTGFAERWEWFYRSQRYWKALALPVPRNVRRRFLADSFGSRRATIFHGLNQRLPRRPFRRQVTTFHDLFVLSAQYSTPEFRARFAAQARHAAEHSDLVIAVSAFTAHQVEDLLRIPAARIRVIHHGVNHIPAPMAAREKVVLCVGALQKRKNQAGLVRAFAAMPASWRLVLAGSAGYGSEQTLEAIAHSPARDRILVTGYLSGHDLAAWYSRAGIFAFPSLDEGFGMPVLEAMASGIPVIAGNRSSLPEVCGDAALLVDPEHDGELANALRNLAEDGPAQQLLVEKGGKRAQSFSWTKAVQQTLDVYKELS